MATAAVLCDDMQYELLAWFWTFTASEFFLVLGCNRGEILKGINRLEADTFATVVNADQLVAIFNRFASLKTNARIFPRRNAVLAGLWTYNQGGHLVTSLGFSVRAEHAHQSQRRLPIRECWVKDHLPITSTAGVIFFSLYKAFELVFKQKPSEFGPRVDRGRYHVPKKTVSRLMKPKWGFF